MSEPTTTSVEQSDERLQQLVAEIIRPSFRRCRPHRAEFFDDFYASLSERAPGIGTLFSQVDMQKQNELIRQGVEQLIDFASGSDTARQELQRLGKSHGRGGLNVAPELFCVWVNTLMDTVRTHDPEADDNVEAAWRMTLSRGIDLMTSLY